MPRVLLGMPGYGSMTAAAAAGYWRACADMRDVVLQYHYGSLLAANFNALWCMALNMAHEGDAPKYFAMMHDDVAPNQGWLDVLIEELESHQLDILGVAIPIKDTTGTTSIALGKQEDTWQPLCRLTMNELFRLPETFTEEDTGYPILINTGCWVCRFDEEWAKKVHFTINDRIAFNTALNRYEPQVEPEDWYFSRLCHELNLKIGCTRKVPIAHRGAIDFSNTRPWGTKTFDSAYIDSSVLDGAGFTFPHDVEGWLSEEEGLALADLARGKRALEIGSYCGRSTICLAQTADEVFSVDTHDGRGTPNPRPTFDDFQRNLVKYGVASKVRHSDTVPNGEYQCDLAFIDGSHDLDSVNQDIDRVLPLLSEEGVMAFHDYRESPGEYDGRWDAGVTEAVNGLLERGGSLLSRKGTIAVVRPPAMEAVA